MDELVGAAPVVLIRVLSVLGLREGEISLSWRLELGQFVDLVLGEKTAVVIADVGIATSTV